MNWYGRDGQYVATGAMSGIRVVPRDGGFFLVDLRGPKARARGPFETAADARDAAERMTGRVAA